MPTYVYNIENVYRRRRFPESAAAATAGDGSAGGAGGPADPRRSGSQGGSLLFNAEADDSPATGTSVSRSTPGSSKEVSFTPPDDGDESARRASLREETARLRQGPNAATSLSSNQRVLDARVMQLRVVVVRILPCLTRLVARKQERERGNIVRKMFSIRRLRCQN